MKPIPTPASIRDAEDGATCDEVEVVLGLRHQTASARIRDLVIAKRIFDTGRRRLTRSGRKARIYFPIALNQGV